MKQINKKIIIRDLKDYFKRKNVDRVILFGSFAKDDFDTKSDLDIIIVMATERRFFYRHEEFLDMYDIFQNELDLLIYTQKEWERMKDRIFFKNILKESIVVL